MPTDVIIEPGSGQIYWNDSAGSPQSISIKGDAQNTVSVVGYSGAFSPGSSTGGTFVIASFNDNSGTAAFVPGTTNYDLGSATYRWSVYGYTGNFSSNVTLSSTTTSISTATGALTVVGGVGIGGSLYVGSATAISGITINSGVITGSLTGTATTSQNVNVNPATTSTTLYLLGANNTAGSGLAVSSNSSLSYNTATSQLTTPFLYSSYSSGSEGGEIVLNKPASGSGLTTTITVDIQGDKFRIFETGGANRGFYLDFSTDSVAGVGKNIIGTGSASGSATTSYNLFTVAANTNSTHYVTFSPNNGGSGQAGVAVSSDVDLTYNPSTNILSAGVFSGNFTGTAATATNFYGTHVGNVTGTSTTSQNVHIAILGNPNSFHPVLMTPNQVSSGSAVSANGTVVYNPSSDTLYSPGFAVTSGANSTSTTTGALTVTGGLGMSGNAFIGGTVTVTNSTASNSTATGAVVITGGLGVGGQINSASIVTSGNAVFNGNLQFKGTGTFGDNVALDTIAFNARSTTDFVPSVTNTNDLGLSSLVWRNLYANNINGIAVTATNFYGTLLGNSSTATTSQNLNTTAATTAGVHYLLFSPVNATTSGVAVSSDASLQFNPATNVLTTDVFSGNLSATAATATNFYGTLNGNVTGTATTAQNLNVVSANTNATHYVTFTPTNGGSGVAVSTDTNFTFNSLTNVLASGVFSGNLSATAATSGLFAVGNLTYAASNLLAAFQSSVNSYNQVIIQNSNNGTSASSDLVVNNDLSTDGAYYGTFGMNSSGFTGLGSTNIANAVYLTSTSSELVVGTTTNNRIRFVNENIDTLQITGTGTSVYTTTASLSKNSGAFVVAGGAAIGLSLSVGQGLHFYNATNGNFTGFKAGATSSNSVYTMPLAYPSTGTSVLQSDTAGTLVWVPMTTGGGGSPGGSIGDIQLNSGSSTFTSLASSYLNVSTTTGMFKHIGYNISGTSASATVVAMLVGAEGLSTFSGLAKGTILALDNTSGNGITYNFIDAQFYNGTPSQKSVFSVDYLGNITHADMIITGSNYSGTRYSNRIRTSTSQVANYSYILPLALPSTGTSFLQCDTSGNMSWVNAPTGGSGSPSGSSKQIQYNNAGAFGGAAGFEYVTAGNAVTVSMFSTAGGGYTAGLFVNVLSATSTKIGIGTSNPQFELEINGELSATNKSFVIEHPTKPGLKLRYGSLEGPENGVYVRGELKGINIIEVPDHWIGLVYEDTYTVHLTPIERYAQLYVEKIENYNVYVADDGLNPIHCYYSVWAERKDIPKLVTEY